MQKIALILLGSSLFYQTYGQIATNTQSQNKEKESQEATKQTLPNTPTLELTTQKDSATTHKKIIATREKQEVRQQTPPNTIKLESVAKKDFTQKDSTTHKKAIATKETRESQEVTKQTPPNTPTLESATQKDFTQKAQKDSTTHKKAILPSVVVVSSWKKDELSNPKDIELYGKDTPLHSGDVAKSMLLIPGFSMTRKGGGGSEIFFRSQSASRLPIFLSGGVLNGACGGRMDTTITYTFPENYDHISIYKGPQDVRYGALIAGGVLFERNIARLKEPSFKANASLLYGSFNRLDINANAIAGNKYGSLQAIISHYSANDYNAGDSTKVHSAYNRESISVIGTITPTENTALELDIDMGRGFASYADRAMDARTFDRISYNLKYQQRFGGAFDLLDIRAWYNGIDHIMDNFSNRPILSGTYNINNPKRTSIGARIEGRFYFNDIVELYIGGSYNNDFHELRSSSGQDANAANSSLNTPYRANFLFENAGLFTQGSYLPDSNFGIFFGTRYDYISTLQHSTSLRLHDNLGSAFSRYEQYFDNATLYIGLGIAQRAADFWERSKNGGMALLPETNTQIDMGINYKQTDYNIRVSTFASYMLNYIVLHYGANATDAFNTNAMLLGGEIEGEYIFLDSLHLYGSLSYTYGQNLTAYYGNGYYLQANTPLPQIAPLQGQASLFYNNAGWLLRLDMFFNAAQNLYAKDFGNVIGKDLGASKGFAIINLYGGYQFKNIMLLAGIDNIFDTLYAYHLSKSGVDIGALGIESTSRIYEPGRSIWAKIKMRF